jgi:hypothetical protein
MQEQGVGGGGKDWPSFLNNIDKLFEHSRHISCYK